MHSRSKTTLFAVCMFFSSFLGSVFLLFPFLLFAVGAPTFYRCCCDVIIGFWTTFPVALVKYLFKIRFRVFGDDVKAERSIILMNHRTRLDWLFFWNVLFIFDKKLLSLEKIVLKAPLRGIPGAGWAMECNAFVFISRNWESDRKVFDDAITFLAKQQRPYTILFFPEGTDFCANSRQRSDRFAETNNLPKYSQLLHPRTTGFVHLFSKLYEAGSLDSIYDVTVAYPDSVVQTEVDLLCGDYPSELHFHIKRHAVNKLQFDAADPNDLGRWCREIWQTKHEMLEQYFSLPVAERSFQAKELTEATINHISSYPSREFLDGFCLWGSIFLWFSAMAFWIYLLLTVNLVRIYALVAVFTFKLIEKYYNGIERFEIALNSGSF